MKLEDIGVYGTELPKEVLGFGSEEDIPTFLRKGIMGHCVSCGELTEVRSPFADGVDEDGRPEGLHKEWCHEECSERLAEKAE